MYTSAILTLLLPLVLAHVPAPPQARGVLDVDVTVGTCVKLGAALDLSAALPAVGGGVQAAAGVCLCVDAQASLNVLSGNTIVDANADVDVYLQAAVGAAGAVEIGGSPAKTIQAAVDGAVGAIIGFPSTSGRCNIPYSLFPNSHHDFSKGCCGRSCDAGYTYNSGTALSGGPFCQKVQCPNNKPKSFTTSSGSTICVANCGTNQINRPSDGTCICPTPFIIRNGQCVLQPVCTLPQISKPDGTCGLPVCTAPLVPQPNGQCGCPATQSPLPGGGCGCNPSTEILCQGVCKSKTAFSCPSGVLTPRRKRGRYECGLGKTFCPVVGSQGWDCVDTMIDIESCGGCSDPSVISGPGFGQDCTAIPGTDVVSCFQGACRIHTCQAGWTHAADGKTCKPVVASLDAEAELNTTLQSLVILRQS